MYVIVVYPKFLSTKGKYTKNIFHAKTFKSLAEASIQVALERILHPKQSIFILQITPLH